MKQLLVLLTLLICQPFTAPDLTAKPHVGADEPVNVLLIVADDLNCNLSCYGHELVKSPHIDRLAARGVRFDRAYCQYPLCNPTRASFLTGLRPNATRVFDNGAHFRTAAPDIVTLPEHFRRNGYATAGIGKLFHDGVPKGTTGLNDPQSWDYSINPHGRERDEIDRIHSLIPGKVGGQVSWLADEGDSAELTDAVRASAAIEWLKKHQKQDGKQKPFFLAVGFYRPHTPYVAPASYFERYPLDRIDLPEQPFADRDDIPLAALPDKPEQLEMTDEQRRSAIQGYYASTSFMDAQVGRLMTALEELDLTSRTVVVFMSDHGYHLGEHGLWQKRSLFEESARVPLIIAAPNIEPSVRASQRLVELVDLFPTLADLCGLSHPVHLQGRSLEPLLARPDAPFRADALTQVICATHSLARPNSPQGYSIRTERYRYTQWNDGQEGIELYDHANDPREQSNRAFDPAYQEVVVKLRKRLANRVRSRTRESSEAEVSRLPLRDETSRSPVRIVTLGDSITKGARRGVRTDQTFAALLERSLSAQGLAIEVANAGIGGERTDQALKRLDDIISLKPHLVTIMYGTNDSAIDRGKNSSRLSSAKYRTNLVQIVDKLKAAGIAPVLMTEPCMGDAQRVNGIGEHPNIALETFTNHCRKVARELDVPLVDHFRYWTKQSESGIDVGQWTTDQCHPNPEGHRQIAVRMLPTVAFALAQAGIAEPIGNNHRMKQVVAIDGVCAWPNLTLLPDGTIAAVVFNQPSHGQQEGDIDCWASRDGLKWERRSTITRHERNTIRMNHAAGVARNGNFVVLCSGWTNEKQPERPKQLPFRDAVLRPWVLRSKDGGRTWEKRDTFPAAEAGWTEYIPFGDIWVGKDGALHTSCYQGQYTDPTKTFKPKGWRSWHFRSDDDGWTWKPVSIIGARHNETNLFPLGGKSWLAAARFDRMELIRSDDNGVSWGDPQPVTQRNEINGHLIRLEDDRLLLSYGVRVRGQRGVCAKLSSDDGQTWSEPVRLAYTVGNADCGYPSSVQLPNGKIVTAWYSKQTPNHDGYHMGITKWNAPGIKKTN